MTTWFASANNVVAGTAVTMLSGDTLYVVERVLVGSSGGADGIVAADSCDMQIRGTVLSASGRALHATDGGQSVFIADSGAISGMTEGLRIEGAGNNFVVNDGTISGLQALTILGADNAFTNSGHVAGVDEAIVFDSGSITNSGTIESSGAATIQGDAGASIVLDNSGTIMRAAGQAVIVGASTQWTITNTGTIIGNATLGTGADSYNGAQGTLSGSINGNGGDDTIVTGANDDVLIGSTGSDTLTSGAGHDIYSYGTANSGESGGTAHDTIADFDADADSFSLFATVEKIQAAVTVGRMREAHFVKDLRHAIGTAQMGADHAVLFTADAGSLKGHTFLVVDANGRAGFQGDKDYVFDVTGAAHLNHLSTDDFLG